MIDLFSHAAARQRAPAGVIGFAGKADSPEARARRRRVQIDLARGLIEEARLCRLLGWPRAAAWWLARAALERRGAASKGDTVSPLRDDLAASGRACQAGKPAMQGREKGDMVSPLEGDR